jgi:hypothetical protein
MKYLYTVLGILILSSFCGGVMGQVNYNTGYPMLNNIGETSVTIETEINTAGYVTSFIVLPQSDPIPSIQEVLDWSYDGNGGILPNGTYGDIQPFGGGNANQLYTSEVNGLLSGTNYVVYLATSLDYLASSTIEETTLSMTTPSQLPFTTLAPPGPDYNDGFPLINNINDTGATLTANINTSGYRTYVVVLAATEGAPSIQQVIDWARTGNGGSLPLGTYGFVPTGRNPGVADTDYSLVITGLTALTDYVAYVVSSTNFSSVNAIETGVANAIPFKTSGQLSIISYSPLKDETNASIEDPLVLTFNQDISFPVLTSGEKLFEIVYASSGITSQTFRVNVDGADPLLDDTGNQLTINLRSNLIPNTEYYIYISPGGVEGIGGTPFTGINNAADNNWRFTTVGAPEWSLGYPQTRNISMINVDIVGRTDKAGTYYYVVTNSATVPSIAQIKNGLNHNGTEALFHNSASPGTMTADTEFVDALNIDGLDIVPTTYYVYYVAVSGIGLDSSIGTTTFTTVERDAPTATFNPLNGATGVSVSSNIVVTYNEPVRNLDGSVIDNTNAKNLVNIPGFSDYSVTIDATKQILTITPNSPFASSTTYSVIINPVEDWFGNEQSGVMSSSFTTSDFVTWNGSVSTDWSNLANWTGTLAPGFNALIPAAGIINWPDVTTNTSFYANDIVIEAGAELNISSTGTLLVTGYFIMVSSNAGKGNASLINNGTLNISSTNKVQIQQNVTDSPVKWYYISSPVAGASQSSIGCDGSMQIWDTSVGEFATISPATTMESARGYRSWSNSNMVFSGSINNASEYSYIANQTTKNPYGWELVGNPYPCSVDWGGIGNTGLLDAFWIWINDQSKYGTYNGNSLLGTNLDLISPAVIPSNQAFWVRVAGEGYLGASGTVTIPRAARTHNQTTYLKSANQARQAVVRLTAINGAKTDEVVVAFNPEALDSFDDFDSEKLFAPTYANHLDIYSFTREELLTINTYSELISDRAIPLGVKVPKDGAFEIKLSELRNIADDTQVLIEDKVENTITDMRESNFVFTAKAGKVEERFVLHVKPNVATSVDDVTTGRVKIYSNGKTVYLEVGDLTNPTYKVHTLSGQMIMQGKLLPGVLNSTEINYEGVVIVTISSKESVLSEKVFVK